MADNNDELRNQVRSQMEAIDNGEEPQAIVEKTDETETEQVTDNSSPSPENETGKDKDKEASQKTDEKPEGDEAENKEAGGKKQTKYERGKERLEKIRQDAEQAKKEAREARDAAERLKAEVERKIAESGQRNDAGRFSVQDLSRAADYYENEADKAFKDGDIEKFNENIKNSREIRNTARRQATAEYQSAQQKAVSDFQRAYEECAEKVITDHPEYGVEGEACTEMNKILDEFPILSMIPNGFAVAHQVREMRQKSGKADELSAENTKLKAEVERLTKLSALEDGSPTPPSGGENFDKLSPEKKRAKLRAEAERADGIR
jgi:hypothetical protein